MWIVAECGLILTACRLSVCGCGVTGPLDTFVMFKQRSKEGGKIKIQK